MCVFCRFVVWGGCLTQANVIQKPLPKRFQTLSSRPSFYVWHISRFLAALPLYCTESASEILKPCDVTGRYHAFPLNIYCSNFWNIQKYASIS